MEELFDGTLMEGVDSFLGGWVRGVWEVAEFAETGSREDWMETWEVFTRWRGPLEERASAMERVGDVGIVVFELFELFRECV